ncbi:hypothetical protein BABINDRAFT_177457 [Babjeviella inositovora NRRL Y-12698]|uniref:TEA domain-containing protein n=1 Tax=Babjeviella inositovora NRRL Y-12698 TaxID=984486 RepID=A0A1E3QKP7_9ASCO|nr:uncharacterized protein BABINDRAFT_177457 [Babjeviella inositovora NRRL Y-12698]ODQ78261.1 hypothetical protein BABINDRAFT_177457 [Babjeviella inositovora NRRL Y-12698]
MSTKTSTTVYTSVETTSPPLLDIHPPTSKRRLPVIVDIAIDSNGKQVYQVHNTNKRVRKSMPIIGSYSRDLIPIFDYDALGLHGYTKTPTRHVLGAISPTTSSRNRYFHSRPTSQEFNETEQAGGNAPDMDDSPTGTKGLRNKPKRNTEKFEKDAAEEEEEEVWGSEVEKAFEEALEIIPKNGLNKIKVSGGKSCGRNELISDYIVLKTGKLRTRKQVSSHIQVIKNMDKDTEIIELIEKGPRPQDLAKNNEKFEEIFSTINFQKSLGQTVFHNQNLRRKSPTTKLEPILNHPVQMESISLDVTFFKITFISPSSSHVLSKLNSYPVNPTLKIKYGASFEHRFPKLSEISCLIDEDKTPVIHNMVHLHVPIDSFNPNTDQGEYDSRLKFTLHDLPSSDISWSSLTIIYSYGVEVSRFNETLSPFDCTPSPSGTSKLAKFETYLAKKFWRSFLDAVNGPDSQKDDSKKTCAIKGITIQQVIYSDNPTPKIHEQRTSATTAAVKLEESSSFGLVSGLSQNIGTNRTNVDTERTERSSTITADNIRSVMLWEFMRCSRAADSETLSRKIVLPGDSSIRKLTRPLTDFLDLSCTHNTHSIYRQVPQSHSLHTHRRSISQSQFLNPLQSEANKRYISSEQLQHQDKLHFVRPYPKCESIGLGLENNMGYPFNNSTHVHFNGGPIVYNNPAYIFQNIPHSSTTPHFNQEFEM